MDVRWDLSATSGMVGTDIDEEFLSKMSTVEFDYFFNEVNRLENMCAREKYKRSTHG